MADLRDADTKALEGALDRIAALVESKPDFAKTDLPSLIVTTQDGKAIAGVMYFSEERDTGLEAVHALEEKLHAALPAVPESAQESAALVESMIPPGKDVH